MPIVRNEFFGVDPVVTTYSLSLSRRDGSGRSGCCLCRIRGRKKQDWNHKQFNISNHCDDRYALLEWIPTICNRKKSHLSTKFLPFFDVGSRGSVKWCFLNDSFFGAKWDTTKFEMTSLLAKPEYHHWKILANKRSIRFKYRFGTRNYAKRNKNSCFHQNK